MGYPKMDYNNAIANIYLALADEVLSSVAEKKTSKEIWETNKAIRVEVFA